MNKTTTAILFRSFEFKTEGSGDHKREMLYETPACIVHFYGAEEEKYSELNQSSVRTKGYNPHRFLLEQGFEIIAKDVYVIKSNED